MRGIAAAGGGGAALAATTPCSGLPSTMCRRRRPIREAEFHRPLDREHADIVKVEFRAGAEARHSRWGEARIVPPTEMVERERGIFHPESQRRDAGVLRR